MNRSKILVSLLLSIPVLAVAFEGIKSGLQPGDMVSSFMPTHVTGPDAGTNTCPICKYGKTPAVQVWVNGDSPSNVVKIAKALQGAIKMNGADKLKAFVVFIKPSGQSGDDLASSLKKISAKNHLHDVALTYVDGPKADAVGQYKIDTDAEVKNTVIVYHDMKVDASFTNLKGDEKGLMSLKGALMQACGM